MKTSKHALETVTMDLARTLGAMSAWASIERRRHHTDERMADYAFGLFLAYRLTAQLVARQMRQSLHPQDWHVCLAIARTRCQSELQRKAVAA